MKQLTTFLANNTSGKKVLGLFILTNVVYLYMVFVTGPRTMHHANGLRLLDIMPTGYNLNDVNKLFDALGTIGRETYLTRQIPVDMIYPLLSGLTYCLILGYVLKKLNKLNTPFLYICVLPLIAGLVDYLENFGIIILLKSYPDISQSMVSIISVFTVIKFIISGIFFLALIILFAWLGIRTLNRKKIHSAN